jgi:gluconate 2-dehydrogenase gamma chain
MSNDTNRRNFLKTLGTVGATGVVAAVGVDAPVEAALTSAEPQAGSPAAVAPGGTDCGVAIFIDRQLAGAWGTGDKTYMQGPWQKGAPTQGYQSPLTPAEFFRAGIAATNAYCRKTLQKDFDRLTTDQQVKLLQDLEQGKVTLDGVSGQEFFNLLLATAMQGFFADPVYGGNRDKVSWKMVGFPGAVAIYSEHIKTYRNKKYDVEPKSIVDLS